MILQGFSFFYKTESFFTPSSPQTGPSLPSPRPRRSRPGPRGGQRRTCLPQPPLRKRKRRKRRRSFPAAAWGLDGSGSDRAAEAIIGHRASSNDLLRPSSSSFSRGDNNNNHPGPSRAPHPSRAGRRRRLRARLALRRQRLRPLPRQRRGCCGGIRRRDASSSSQTITSWRPPWTG